jgi:hypothetical protein
MRRTIILTAAGLTLALTGVAIASDPSGERRHSERGESSRSHDERSEHGTRQGKRRNHDESREHDSREGDHDGDRKQDSRKARSDRRS